MNVTRRIVFALGAVLAFGCGAQREAQERAPVETARELPPDPQGDPPAPTRTQAETERRPAPLEPADAVRTEPFAPSPIRVTLDELPPPRPAESVRHPPQVVAPPADAYLRVPPGFRVQVVRRDLPNARWLAQTPNGRILVACSRDNRIVALDDDDGDGTADHAIELANASAGLDLPLGMAFARGHLYVASQDHLQRFPWPIGTTRLDRPGQRILALPGGGYRQHWTRNLAVAPDGEHLFLSIGSESNVLPEAEPRATIQRLSLDAGEVRTFASGLRNPVGLAVHPQTGELYTTVNERDHLGDDLVPDYFTQVVDGAFYGWPYAYLAPGNLDPRRVRGDGTSEQPALAGRTRTPDVLFQAHSAPLGLAFYDGEAFPERYRGGAFVAFRGSWNRSEGTGYKVVFVPFADGRPEGHYEDFVTGFLTGPSLPLTWARPVGMLMDRNGSLLFTDEGNGIVYRVVYVGAE